jgi:hypothetical protein
MKNSIAVITAVVVLTISGLALAQMDKGKEMMGDKSKGMMDDKGMGMKNSMMEKGGMMGMHGMMMKMMEKTVVATSDGGIIIVSANKISKYDKDLNLVKEVELKAPTMEEMQKMCPMMGKGGMMEGGMMDGDMGKPADKPADSATSEVDHASHHPENK